MSKLDNDLYQTIKGHASWNLLKPDDLTIPDSEMKPLIQDLKDLILDLINASDAYVATGSDNGVWRSDKDLREKVSAL